MLRTVGITKRYDAQLALDNVSITFERGAVTGLVGENGAGKSTLLNVLCGIAPPDAGKIFLDDAEIAPQGYRDANGLGIWRVFQEPALIGGIPLYENLFLGHEKAFTRLGIVNHSKMIREAQRIVAEFGIDVDVRRMTSEFSYSIRQSAEAVKAAAVPEALGLPRAFVLFDEPTAGLSHEEVPYLLGLVKELASRGLGVAFVSHRLNEVLDTCRDIFVLKDGAVVAQTTAADSSEAGLHELMVGRIRHADFHAENRQGSGLKEQVALSVRDLGQRARAQGNRTDASRYLFREVSFELRKGEILGVTGLVGSGKSALARCVAGVERPDEGEVVLDGTPIRRATTVQMKRKGVVYLSPDRRHDGLIQTDPLKWSVSLPSGDRDAYGFVYPGGVWKERLERRAAVAAIQEFRIKATPGMATWQLSGGNQQKVVLAKWTRRDPSVIAVENPTAGVDVGAKADIYVILRNLAESGTAVLLVGDDLPEVIGLSDRILVMRNGRIVETINAPAGRKPDEASVVARMT